MDPVAGILCLSYPSSQIEGVMTVILAQQSGNGGLLGGLLPLVIIGVLFYFLLIRPQQKRARDQRQLVDSLGVGDMVVTIGGFHGTITGVDDTTVRLELNPTNTVTLSKQAIARRTIAADTGSEEVTEE
ncbi:MAG TPA: preprotein translocase subunit YajC [Euzebyales bacterium]|nr:preprotein translocase subunit YajC [Euzebyales bacterium]